jgi:hypothetical protein
VKSLAKLNFEIHHLKKLNKNFVAIFNRAVPPGWPLKYLRLVIFVLF